MGIGEKPMKNINLVNWQKPKGYYNDSKRMVVCFTSCGA